MKKVLLFLSFLLLLGAVACRDGSNRPATPTTTTNNLAAVGLPELEPGWTKIEPGGETRCAHDTTYAFWVRPGTVNKLMVYFQGGGGCWDAETCRMGSDFYDPSVTERDNPQYLGEGLFNMDNAENPFRDYYMVFAPSCTADIYMGTVERTYQPENGRPFTIQHKGGINGQAAVQWVFDHFSGPESVFVIGCSAGSIGSAMFAPYLMEHYPQAQVSQLGDSLGFLFSQPTDVEAYYGASAVFPDWIPALQALDPTTFTMADYYTAVASHYPQRIFSQFNWSLDGVQERFYTAGGGDPANYGGVIAAALDQIHAKTPNFRSYTALGSGHCITPSDFFYGEEVDGLRFRDWMADLANGEEVSNVREIEE